MKKDDGGFIIRVSDTGIGMSAEKLYKLRTIESANEGAGYFNVSRRIKSWKNAQIDIQSTEGEGTAITIKISESME